MPEPVAATRSPTLSLQRPQVPAAIRHPFLIAALGVLASWGLGGLLLSLGPALSASVFDTTDHLLTATVVVGLGVTASISQVVFRRVTPWVGTSVGSVVLAIGTLLIVFAAMTDSALPLVAGAVIGGAGFGVAFLGALRALSAVIPPEHRGSVMSAFYIVAYLSLSVPAIIAGVLVTPLGVEPTFEIFGTALTVVALIVAGESWRTRPRRAQPRAAWPGEVSEVAG